MKAFSRALLLLSAGSTSAESIHEKIWDLSESEIELAASKETAETNHVDEKNDGKASAPHVAKGAVKKMITKGWCIDQYEADTCKQCDPLPSHGDEYHEFCAWLFDKSIGAEKEEMDPSLYIYEAYDHVDFNDQAAEILEMLEDEALASKSGKEDGKNKEDKNKGKKGNKEGKKDGKKKDGKKKDKKKDDKKKDKKKDDKKKDKKKDDKDSKSDKDDKKKKDDKDSKSDKKKKDKKDSKSDKDKKDKKKKNSSKSDKDKKKKKSDKSSKSSKSDTSSTRSSKSSKSSSRSRSKCIDDDKPRASRNNEKYRFKLQRKDAQCVDKDGYLYEYGQFNKVKKFSDCADACVKGTRSSLLYSLRGYDYDCYENRCRCLYDRGTLDSRNSGSFNRTNRNEKGKGKVEGTRKKNDFNCAKLAGTDYDDLEFYEGGYAEREFDMIETGRALRGRI